MKEGQCVEPTLDRQSCPGCAESGTCTPMAGTACQPTTDGACKKSLACREVGQCSLQGIQCVINSA
ncbi:MAG TPA: hypothetical protein PKD61_38735, partial [Polyangiaceae bacterium]|nr:hypothetical protein [Polyangiaceae bacterium]